MNVNLASTLTVSSNYAGGVAGEIIGAAFKEASTIANNLVTVLPDIDFQMSLRKISYANGRTAYTCGFTPQGAVTLSEVLLTPTKIKNELEICKEDLRQIWSSSSMGFSAHNDNMPKDVEAALLNEILGDTAQATDEDIWQGVAATDGRFGGFIELFNADASVIKAGNGITSATAAVTVSNVQVELEKVLSAIPVALRRKKNMVVGLSSNVALAYEQMLITNGISNGLGGAEMTLQYGSTKLSVIDGLPDNTFVAYEVKNLYFGTGLTADHNEIRIKDMDDSDLSGQVRFKMVYTAGCQYVNGNEVVWYLTTT
jgi:hypothetical protein